MPQIIILGSSSGDPSPSRANASILIKVGERYYQFDAGEGCASSIKRNKIDHNAISAIFISHMHPDHIAGLFLEIQMMHLAKRLSPLAVYLPSEALSIVKDFAQASYIFIERLTFDLQLKPIIPDPIFRDDAIAIYARANCHLNKYAKIVEQGRYPNQMQSYTFVIKTADSRIIYSGDVGSLDDYVDLLPECDTLITEGLHIDQEALFESAAVNHVEHLILTHLSDDMYRNPEPIMASAQKHGVKSLHMAEDGIVLNV